MLQPHIFQAQMIPLTPSHHAEFEQVSPDVDVEDFDQQKVEMQTLQGHPAERGQQGVMKTKTHVKTKFREGHCCYCLTGEEVNVEEDQSHWETDVDLLRIFFSEFSSNRTNKNTTGWTGQRNEYVDKWMAILLCFTLNVKATAKIKSEKKKSKR